jgi:hypothetical protein
MTADADQPVAGGLWRRFGWPLGIFALACLAIGACVATSSGPRKFQPQPRLDVSPETPVGIRAELLRFVPGSDSRVELRGMTNIGPWASESGDIRGQVVLDVDEKSLNALFDGIQASSSNGQNDPQPPPLALSVRGRPVAIISVPIVSLHSDKPGMDRDMRNALKASQYPAIEYEFQQLQQAGLQWNARNGQPGLKLHAVGKLNMAGVGRQIEMDVTVNRDSRRHFLAHAQTTLLMSDFDVDPPVALFGLIRAGEHVQVTFDLDLILANDLSGEKSPPETSAASGD